MGHPRPAAPSPDRHDHVERRVVIAGARLAVADDQPEQEDVVVLAQQLTSQSRSDALRIVDEADPLTRLDMGGIPSPERGRRARIFGNGPRIGGRSTTGRS
ncbi:MAG: hypothetical protein WKF51_11295 [Geodermatophilaceae bacterium]